MKRLEEYKNEQQPRGEMNSQEREHLTKWLTEMENQKLVRKITGFERESMDIVKSVLAGELNVIFAESLDPSPLANLGRVDS